MAAASKDYRYSIEFNIHGVDAPGTRLIKTGDIYVNICLLGSHKRTRLMPSFLPMHVDQKLFFEKTFKFCYDTHDVLERLEREHVLIEFIQTDVPSPILLASYETTARDFLYPYSSDRIEYTGLRRYILLNRTVDFPGISPSLEFSTSPSIDDVTGLSLSANKTRRSGAKTQSSYRPGSVSRSITSHTISSAVKNDYANRETQEKLRELAVERDINFVTPLDKTKGRPPFVVRHVDNNLIGRKPKSHVVLNDGLVINDFTLSRPETRATYQPIEENLNRSRSISPVLGRSLNSMVERARSRSRSPSPKLSQSFDYDDNYASRDLLSPTLQRDSFRYRYRHTPAADLSDKVIHTLRRNLDFYTLQPWHRYYYSSYLYPDLDDLLIRSRRLMLE